jgi:hypothetical protein
MRLFSFFLALQKDWYPRNMKWCYHRGKFKASECTILEGPSGRAKTEREQEHGSSEVGPLSIAIDHGLFGSGVLQWGNPAARRVNSTVKNCPTRKLFLDAHCPHELTGNQGVDAEVHYTTQGPSRQEGHIGVQLQPPALLLDLS